MTTDSLEERLATLESRLAHHERMAEDLSDVLADQYRIVDILMVQVRRLTERVRELEAGPVRAAEDEKPPPHY